MDEKDREALDNIEKDPWPRILKEQGMTMEKMLKLHKKELSAKATKTITVKGGVDPDNLPKGVKIVTTTSKLHYPSDGGLPRLVDGYTVLQWEEDALDLRQKGRMDAYKLLNGYPPEKIEAKVDIGIVDRILEARKRAASNSDQS